MIPAKLKNFNVFLDGESFAGVAKEVTPGALIMTTEDYRGGGMDAPVAIDMGMEQPVVDIVMAEYVPSVVALFGNHKQVTLRGAFEGPGGIVPVIITARGLTTSVDLGGWTAGGDTQKKIMIKCEYYRLMINGRNMAEIDIENMIRIIDGVDQLAAQRLVLGI